MVTVQPSVLAELEGVVVLDADENLVRSNYDDVLALPNKLVCRVALSAFCSALNDKCETVMQNLCEIRSRLR